MPKKKPVVEDMAWDDEPPEQLMPYLEIRRVPAGGEVKGKILSDGIVGVRTHYMNFRTIAHLKDKRRCEGCRNKWPIRWRGYLYCLDDEGKAYIAEVTFMGFKACKALKTWKGDLRGRKIRQTRKGRGDNGMQICEISEEKTTFANRFGLPDLREMLAHIWAGAITEQEEPNEQGG